eukprot:scaffold5.g949.t1
MVGISGAEPMSAAVSHSSLLLQPRLAPSRRCSLRVSAQGNALGRKPPPAITLTDAARTHLGKLRKEKAVQRLLLRMGVKTGGCSGLSYDLQFEQEGNLAPSDAIFEYEEGLALATDPKSLLYLFGMELDWRRVLGRRGVVCVDALIDGGFKFRNPNADKSCSCGKSFGVTSVPVPEVTSCSN